MVITPEETRFHTFDEFKEHFAPKPQPEEFPGKSEHYIAGVEIAKRACQKARRKLEQAENPWKRN